jgi:hypothetical protein
MGHYSPMHTTEGAEMLSDMLSSRSYLELFQERSRGGAPTARIEQDNRQPMMQPSPESKDEPERRLRSRKKPTSPMVSDIPDQAENRNSAAPDRPARKRGRPRLETAKDAAAIEVDPAGPHMIETSMLTSSTGTPSADSAGATYLPTQKGGHNPNPEISRRFTRTNTRECRGSTRPRHQQYPKRRPSISHPGTHSGRNKQNESH